VTTHIKEPVTVAIADGVATVTVDSPPVNAMGVAVLTGLRAVAERLAGNRAARAVVLTGAGTKAFIAGADITEFAEILARPDGMRQHAELSRSMFQAWQELPQPLIAAVQASAIGGGLEFALACDLIVADEVASFGLPEVKLGIIPGAGGTQRLPARIGLSAAKEMMLLGSTIDADRALRLGLINRLAANGKTLEVAQGLATQIAARPWMAVAGIKRAADAANAFLDAGLNRELEIFLEVAKSDDFAEGFSAFLEKRKPRFSHT
jgi:enoyl-CoA hydratase/carnithine racemase